METNLVGQRKLSLLFFLIFLSCFGVDGTLDVPKNFREEGYSQAFFDQHRQNAVVYHILAQIIKEVLPFKIDSTVDVGCGHGLLVEAWRLLPGRIESYGVEGSSNASGMWPSQYVAKYYRIQDLTTAKADMVPPTDLVTTFEVAEHLPPNDAGRFVHLVTIHSPKAVVFGAATPGQDRGQNPSHVNENTFAYWIHHFADNSYIVDWGRTAKLRHVLLTQPIQSAWWYPKNALIFVPISQGNEVQKYLAGLDGSVVNMFNEVYLTYGVTVSNDPDFHEFWKRDWLMFAGHFHSEQAHARVLVDREKAMDSSCAEGRYAA